MKLATLAAALLLVALVVLAQQSDVGRTILALIVTGGGHG